jgi:hypothetical protein
MAKRKLEEDKTNSMEHKNKKPKLVHTGNANSLMRRALVCNKKQASPLLKVFLFGEGTDWLEWRTVCKDWAISRTLIPNAYLIAESKKAIQWQVDYFYGWYTRCSCSELNKMGTFIHDNVLFWMLNGRCRQVDLLTGAMNGCFSGKKDTLDRKVCWELLFHLLNRTRVRF